MNKKIEWYREVLALEPGSKVFFPLARLFMEMDQLNDAASTLKIGLDRHPDFMEARLLLVQVLNRLGKPEEAAAHVHRIVEPLQNYPAFWKLWAKSLPEDQRDVAVFLMLVASSLAGKAVRWTDVVMEGLNSLSERLVGESVTPDESGADDLSAPVEMSAAPLRRSGGDFGSLRTKTMADVLASQGDHQGAMDIYRELWEKASSDAEREELSGRISAMEARLGEGQASAPQADREDVFSKHSKNRLLSTLESLASRFEARIRS